MDSQQQQVYKYSQQMDAIEHHVEAPQQAATTSIVSYEEPYVLDHPLT